MQITLDDAKKFFLVKRVEDIKSIRIYFSGKDYFINIDEIIYILENTYTKPNSSEYKLLKKFFYNFFDNKDWHRYEDVNGTVEIFLEDGKWEIFLSETIIQDSLDEGTLLDLKED
jgi:hypothetical protein